jgi:predicted nucleic acid-binding protein
VAGELLLDTGGLVSLLDRDQPQHTACRRVFEEWTGPVVSTEAVLTEAAHLMARVDDGVAKCVEFFLAGGALLVPSSATSLKRAHTLIKKYADQPMDFADASLVVLAEHIGTSRILTTDRRDFSVYRVHGRKAFDILPDAEAMPMVSRTRRPPQ